MRTGRTLGLVAGASLISLVCGLNNVSSSSKVADADKPTIEVKFYNPWTNKPFEFEKPKNGYPLRDGPVYSPEAVPANMCSRYARLAAEKLFGISYPSADAWDIRDDKNISEIQLEHGQKSFASLAIKGKLRPGMLLGVYNPKSKYNDRAQKSGAGYTHVMLYLGQENGEFFFADKFGQKTRTKISLTDMVNSGLEPRELLFVSK